MHGVRAHSARQTPSWVSRLPITQPPPWKYTSAGSVPATASPETTGR
jgi:hypothetical protein